MKLVLVVSVLMFSLFQFGAFAAEETSSLVTACKADCPKAKTDEETHNCAEKKGRLNKEFRKSKCWEVNEEYEKKVAAEKK